MLLDRSTINDLSTDSYSIHLNESNTAIPFITYSKENKECKDMIKNINSNFGVISIAGLYRTGKSFLLNKMLLNKSKESKGFIVGKTINACTKGLWIYNKPIIGLNEDRKSMPVFIIDTEGFGSIEEDINHDIRIFSLSVLLSSCFIYNSVGSIDESSIEALSFVINLANFIQMNSSNEKEYFFPQFLWILRDFSLKLQSDDGVITPKQYLENALSTSKNMDIKNIIKKFFKERDCFPMVRPITQEKDLQNLDDLPNEKLRTEFLEQVIRLRKRILNNCKTKKFRDMAINGHQFITIINSYLEMINSGAVPSFDNIWISLCKSETYKAIEFAMKEYENIFKETKLSNGLKYLTIDQLEHLHKESKEKSLIMFKKIAIGEEKFLENFLDELKQKIKDKYNLFKNLNEDEITNELHKYLKKRFEKIEIKIKSYDITNIPQLENELHIVENEICEYLPDSEMRFEAILDFKYRIVLFGSTFLLSNLEFINESNIEDKNNLLEKNKNEFEEMKEKFEKETKRKDVLINELKNESLFLKKESEAAKEKYNISETENEQKINMMTENITTLRKEYTREMEQLNSKIVNLEEAKVEADRKNKKIEGDYEKEKALTEQNMEYLNKLVEEYSRREKNFGQDLKSQLKEQSNAFRESSIKYENNIKYITEELDKYKDKYLELESVLSNKENLLELERLRIEELILKFNNERQTLNERLNVFKKKLDEEREKFKIEISEKDKQLKNVLGQLRFKEEEYTIKIHSIQEEYKNNFNKIEKEYLILKQTNEFLVVKSNDASIELIEQKQNQERIMSALETKLLDSDNIRSGEFQRKIEEIKKYYENEKKIYESSFLREKEILLNEISQIKIKINIFSSNEEEQNKLKDDLKSEITKLTKANEILHQDKIQLEESNRENQKQFFIKIKLLNDEMDKHLEEKEKIYQTEIKNININSEESINQFKSLFEIEKLRLEDKYKDEKYKYEKKLKVISEENENRIKELEKEYKEELEEVNAEYNKLGSDHQNYMLNSEYEKNLYNQKIESLEIALNDAKESISVIKNKYNQTSEFNVENFKLERKELNKKLEETRNECNIKEKELTSVNSKKEVLEKSLYENEQSYNKERRELEEDIKEMISKHENYKSKQQEIIDELLIKKLEFTRETALLKQQIEFLNTKIEDQNKINEENQKDFQENLFALKVELIRDFNIRLELMQREKEDLVDKFNKKKKELRDLEQTFLKQTCMVEKEKNALNEKIQLLGNKKKEVSDNYQIEFDKLVKETNNVKAEYFKEMEEVRNYNEELKKKIKELVSSQNENKKLFDNEKQLLESKIKHLEKQRDESKKEMVETQTKMEKILGTVQKKNLYDRNQFEVLLQEKVSVIETQYCEQIKEIEEKHQNIYSEMMTQNQELERELKNLSWQAELRYKSVTDPNAVNKKISDLLEIQEKLKKELDDAKRDKKILESQLPVEKEKDSRTSKINDYDINKKNALVVEFEKEKARWNLEREHLNSKIYELQETVERLQKKNESLLRNIEKLKGGELEREANVINNSNQVNIPGHRKNSSMISSTNLMGAFNKKYIEKEFTSMEFNKPRQINSINSNNNASNNLNNAKNIYENYEGNDKYDYIFNNMKIGLSKSNRNLNKK